MCIPLKGFIQVIIHSMFPQFASLFQWKYVLCICLNITYTGEPDVDSPPKDVKDAVLSECQFFLPESGLTKKLYFDK